MAASWSRRQLDGPSFGPVRQPPPSGWRCRHAAPHRASRSAMLPPSTWLDWLEGFVLPQRTLFHGSVSMTGVELRRTLQRFRREVGQSERRRWQSSWLAFGFSAVFGLREGRQQLHIGEGLAYNFPQDWKFGPEAAGSGFPAISWPADRGRLTLPALFCEGGDWIRLDELSRQMACRG